MSEDKEHDLLVQNTRKVLQTPQGKKVIWHMLSICNLYGDNFTGNSHTFYLEGKRSVGLELLQLLEDVDPEMYPKLLLENLERSSK